MKKLLFILALVLVIIGIAFIFYCLITGKPIHSTNRGLIGFSLIGVGGLIALIVESTTPRTLKQN